MFEERSAPLFMLSGVSWSELLCDSSIGRQIFYPGAVARLVRFVRWAVDCKCKVFELNEIVDALGNHLTPAFIGNRPDNRPNRQQRAYNRLHVRCLDKALGDQCGARDGQDLADQRQNCRFQHGVLLFRFHWWLRGIRPVSSSAGAAGGVGRLRANARLGAGTWRCGRW